MRKPILNTLKCPKCGGVQFDIRKINEDNAEIREAEVACKNCADEYTVKDGIIFFGNEARVPAKDRHPALENDAFMLSLPDIKDSVFDISAELFIDLLKQGENFSAVLEKTEPVQNKLALVIGAGNCWPAAELARRGADCVACDNLLEKYYGLLSADIFFEHQGIYFERVCADFEKLPFADNTFDIVFNNRLLCGAKNLNLIMKEIARVTKPGGALTLSNQAIRTILRGDKKNSTFGQWMKALKKAGFNGHAVFPASATSVLERWRKRLKIKGIKKTGVNLLAALWKLPGIKPAAESILIWPAHTLFGMDFNYVGGKTEVRN